MKQLITKSKIICAIIILVIAIGVAMVLIKGFEIDLKNQATQTIELYIGKSFEIKDIKQITDEVFGNEKVIIQKVEVYEDSISIIAKEITDEQKNNMVQKVNEKYEAELKAEDITIEDIPHTSLKDIVKPYVTPLVIATAIILVYVGIRYYKVGLIKSILKVGGISVVAQLVLFSVMAISRFPVGRYTLPLVLFVYLVTMLGITTNLERNLKEKKLEEDKQ